MQGKACKGVFKVACPLQQFIPLPWVYFCFFSLKALIYSPKGSHLLTYLHVLVCLYYQNVSAKRKSIALFFLLSISQHWHAPWINTGPLSLYLHSYTLDINIICVDVTYVSSVDVSPECHNYTSNCLLETWILNRYFNVFLPPLQSLIQLHFS